MLETILGTKYCKIYCKTEDLSDEIKKKALSARLNLTFHVADFLLRSCILSHLSDCLSQSFRKFLLENIDSCAEEDILWHYSLQDVSIIINMERDSDSITNPVLHIIDLDMKPREKLPIYAAELSIMRSKLENNVHLDSFHKH